MKNNQKNGFSLVEIIVSLGIFSLLLTVGFFSFHATRSKMILEEETQKILTSLKKAQNDSMSSVDNEEHGIYFDIEKYIEFENNFETDHDKQEYFFRTGIKIIDGNGTENKFKRLSGNTSENTITLEYQNNRKTISINKEGVINTN